MRGGQRAEAADQRRRHGPGLRLDSHSALGGGGPTSHPDVRFKRQRHKEQAEKNKTHQAAKGGRRPQGTQQRQPHAALCQPPAGMPTLDTGHTGDGGGGGSGHTRHTSYRIKRRLQLKSASQTPAGPREGSHGHEWRTGAQCRGGGELQGEPRAAHSLEPSFLINWRRRVQGTGPSARGAAGMDAGCRLPGTHSGEGGPHPRDRRQTTWRSCPRSREPGVRLQRESLRRRPRAAHRKRVGGLRGLGVWPPDPGGLPTETVWTGKQGKSGSVQKLLGTTSDNPTACTLTAHSAKKKRLVSETRLCTLLSST